MVVENQAAIISGLYYCHIWNTAVKIPLQFWFPYLDWLDSL